MSTEITTGTKVRHTNRKGDVRTGTVVEIHEPNALGVVWATVELDGGVNEFSTTTPTKMSQLEAI